MDDVNAQIPPFCKGGENLLNTSISIITPTYQERENLPELIRQIAELKKQFSSLELIIVDDDSQDGTEKYIASLDKNWIKLIIRKKQRGLSTAVIEGFTQANNPVLICMDADLSHPVTAIPEMVALVQQENINFVVASRFKKNARIIASWSLLRRINSSIAKWLAKPLITITDPLSGFFCLTKTTFLKARKLNPIGYKIGLELIVKCHCKNIIEVPIYFADRYKGKSKLNLKEQLYYLIHLCKLLRFKYFSG